MDTAARPVLESGARVGQFVIVRLLGAGGMGEVYEARDPELERSVALKLLRGDHPTLGMRLLREAQALAQLQHPNVVAVHALDLHADQVFIAMELVDGEALDVHLERTRPDWRGIVALFVQAGRGLAAAHAKGIVHRDVKPSNLFVDREGRVRVGDFGLARQVDDDTSGTGSAERRTPAGNNADAETVDDSDHETAPGAPTTPISGRGLLASPLTQAGAVLGTPLFMAPEQHLGQKATAATDQFGFCVALWIALHGEHPFAIRTATGRSDLDAVIEGRRRPPSRRPAPGWVIRALDRGLAVDPVDRHPSMRALVDLLDRPTGRRTQLALAFGGAGVAVAAAIAWGVTRGAAAPSDPCPPPTDRIAAVWSEPRRAEIGARFAAIDKVHGAARFAAATRMLDEYSRGLSAAYVEACRETRAGTQSDTKFDGQLECLDARLEEMSMGIASLAEANDAASAEAAVGGLVGVTRIGSCRDDAPPEKEYPVPPASRSKVEALIERINNLQQPRDQGADLLADARAIVAEARTVDYPPLLAGSLGMLSDVEMALGNDEAAEAALRELTQVAAVTLRSRDEAIAWMKLIGIVGSNRKKPAEGLALVPAATAAILRAGDPLDLRVELLYQQSLVLTNGTDIAGAIEKLTAARELLEKATDEEAGPGRMSRVADMWLETGFGLAQLGDFAGSERALTKSIELVQATYGPDTVDESYAWVSLAETRRRAGKLDDALEAATTAVRIREARSGGDTARLAEALVGLSSIHADRGAWDLASAAIDRALEILRGSLEPDDIQLAPALLARATIDDGLGKIDDAVRGLDTLVALLDEAKTTSIELAEALLARAEIATRRGRHAAAAPDHARALATYESLLGRTNHQLARPLLLQGRALVLGRKPAGAIAPLERASTLVLSGDGELSNAIRGWLGRALVESNHDRAGGAVMLRDARAALDAAGDRDLRP